jgi:hypothetical protein
MDLVHQVPEMLNSGLQYIIPMMGDIYAAVLPFAYIVLKVFLVVDIAITCFKKWVVGEKVDVQQQFRDDWYWD